MRSWSARWTGWALIALGISLPLSTSGTSILLGVIVLLWIIGGNYREKWEIMHSHPLAVASLVLFGLYVLGLFYGKPGTHVAFDVSRFLLLALLIPLVPLSGDVRIRQRALWAFTAAVILLLSLSYLSWLDLLPRISFLNVSPSNVVIQDRITYGLFAAVAACFLTIEAFFSESRKIKVLLLILIALICFNLLAIIDSISAYVVLVTLFGYLMLRRWRWKGAVAGGVAVVLIASVVWIHPDNIMRLRLAGAVREIQQWRPDQANDTSQGLRLEFYYHSMQIVRENPLFGVGTGGFAEAYAKQIEDPKMARSDNPHNEYLLVATQLGLIGLAALLYFFYTQWRLTAFLPIPRHAMLAQGVVLAFMVGCMFNSWLTDFDEGVFFVWISALLFSDFKRE